MYIMLYFAFQLNLREKTDNNNNMQLQQCRWQVCI